MDHADGVFCFFCLAGSRPFLLPTFGEAGRIKSSKAGRGKRITVDDGEKQHRNARACPFYGAMPAGIGRNP